MLEENFTLMSIEPHQIENVLGRPFISKAIYKSNKVTLDDVQGNRVKIVGFANEQLYNDWVSTQVFVDQFSLAIPKLREIKAINVETKTFEESSQFLQELSNLIDINTQYPYVNLTIINKLKEDINLLLPGFYRQHYGNLTHHRREALEREIDLFIGNVFGHLSHSRMVRIINDKHKGVRLLYTQKEWDELIKNISIPNMYYIPT